MTRTSAEVVIEMYSLTSKSMRRFLKNVYSVFRASPGPAVGFAELAGSASSGTPGGQSNTNSNNGSTSGAVGRKSVSAAMVFAAAAATAVFMA